MQLLLYASGRMCGREAAHDDPAPDDASMEDELAEGFGAQPTGGGVRLGLAHGANRLRRRDLCQPWLRCGAYAREHGPAGLVDYPGQSRAPFRMERRSIEGSRPAPSISRGLSFVSRSFCHRFVTKSSHKRSLVLKQYPL